MKTMNRIVVWIILCSFLVMQCGCSGGSGGSPISPASANGPVKNHSPLPLAAGQKELPASFLAQMMRGVVQRTSASANPAVKSSRKDGKGGLEIVSMLLELAGLGFDIYHTATLPEEIDKIQNSLNSIQSEVNTLNQNINELAKELNIDFTDLEKEQEQSQLEDDLNAIQNLYGQWTDNKGNPQTNMADPYSLYYFSYNVQQGTFATPLCSNPNSTGCTNYNRFINYLTGNPMQNQIKDINSLMNPSTDKAPYLMIYAKHLVLQNPSDPAKAYKILENTFSKLLNYQLQALAIYANYLDYDPDGTNVEFNNYVKSSFIGYITAELESFLVATDWLVANLYDYRNKEQYQQDMKCVPYGLAGMNDTYASILAGSRLYCATILNAINPSQNPGLAGTIILPYNYTNGGKLTLQFTAQSGGKSYIYNITPTVPYQSGDYSIPSQIPYTKWDSSTATAAPDNRWLSYDLNFCQYNGNTNQYDKVAASTYGNDPVAPYTSRPDIPLGTYTVSIIDYGPNSSAWAHTNSALGSLTVAYYSTSDGSLVPNPTPDQISNKQVVKFGFAALNWPWSFQKISASNQAAWTVENNSFQKYDSGSGAYVNAITYSTPYLNQLVTDGSIHSKSKFSGYDYKLKMPFSITTPIQSSNPFAIVYHSPLGGNQLLTSAGGTDNITVSYSYYLQDSKGPLTLDSYSLTSPKDVDANYSSPEMTNLCQYTGSDLSLTMYLHSTFSDNFSSISMIATRQGKITFRWDMQLLFNGTSPVTIPGD